LTLPAIAPLVPIRSKEIPIGRGWIYELKLDGFRGMLRVENGRAYFTSKTSKPMARFNPLATSLAAALNARNAILDGEIIVMGDGGPDFKALFFRRGDPAYAAFDLLWLNDRDLRALPLWRRKKALQKLVAATPIAYVDDVDDPALFTIVSLRDLEGIVAKRRHDPYCIETKWLKVKCASYSQATGRWELFASDRPRRRRQESIAPGRAR